MKLKKNATLFLVLLTAFALSGCTNTLSTAPAETQTATASQAAEAQEPTAVYYDFEDVLIPKELSIVQDRTVVVSTPGFTSGILVLKGRVERRSLFNFFTNNMQQDNWTIVSQIKSPANSILVFEKASRCAVITIKNEPIYTWVQVGVAPRMTQDGMLSNGIESGQMTQSNLSE